MIETQNDLNETLIFVSINLYENSENIRVTNIKPMTKEKETWLETEFR